MSTSSFMLWPSQLPALRPTKPHTAGLQNILALQVGVKMLSMLWPALTCLAVPISCSAVFIDGQALDVGGVRPIFAELAISVSGAYNPSMSDPTNRSVSDWLTDLEISEAEAAAGETVPLAAILAEFDDSIKRLEDNGRWPPSRVAVAS